MLHDKKRIKILFASRLVIEKGVDILIDTIEAGMLDSQISSNIEWTICSDGDYSDAIVKLTEKYPESVQYLGKVTPEKLALFYREHDFLFMPSRFLETFGLTALESLACGSPVMGIRKGGLMDFISPELAIDELAPVQSSISLIRRFLNRELSFQQIDISRFSSSQWKENLETLFAPYQKILLIHDYEERIGGAEYYIQSLRKGFDEAGKKTEFFAYTGHTTPWKRRWMFIFSIFAFWRGVALSRVLDQSHADAIWMHSVVRYIGFWGISAVNQYCRENPEVRVLLSHHDVGWIAPFPQDVTDESMIPISPRLAYFVRATHGFSRLVAISKWCYLQLYRKVLPKNLTHIIFAPFLEKHIQRHFPRDNIILFPHSYDETLFHP